MVIIMATRSTSFRMIISFFFFSNCLLVKSLPLEFSILDHYCAIVDRNKTRNDNFFANQYEFYIIFIAFLVHISRL